MSEPKSLESSGSVQEVEPSIEARAFLAAMRTIVKVRKEDLVKPQKRKQGKRPVR
jgi:hypothetical protein